MKSRKNRKFTADQKAQAVRRHLWDNVPVSDLAAELEVPPSQNHMPPPSSTTTLFAIDRFEWVGAPVHRTDQKQGWSSVRAFSPRSKFIRHYLVHIAGSYSWHISTPNTRV